MKIFRSIMGMSLFLALSLPAFAQTVKVNWQARAPFHDYRTFAWLKSKKEGDHFYKQWVVRDVNRELQAKGLQEVSLNQHPDVFLLYHEITQQVMDSTTIDDGFGWGGGPWGGWGGWGGWGMGMSMGMGPDMAWNTAEPRSMGILTVDIVATNQKKLIWRGQATVDAVSNKQKGDEKQVLKSVQKMFKLYPPPKEKT
ncbi:MAG TPA: DUF4136 domain-containing protein [Terriglobia bacterium]|nr:DUF4136 domain-containing protein [Terriglobia bacterium]